MRAVGVVAPLRYALSTQAAQLLVHGCRWIELERADVATLARPESRCSSAPCAIDAPETDRPADARFGSPPLRSIRDWGGHPPIAAQHGRRRTPRSELRASVAAIESRPLLARGRIVGAGAEALLASQSSSYSGSVRNSANASCVLICVKISAARSNLPAKPPGLDLGELFGNERADQLGRDLAAVVEHAFRRADPLPAPASG